MVLVISMWDDILVHMNWLDSYMGDDSTSPGALRGPCDPKDGAPEILREDHPDSKYTITNLRWGEFGSTSVSAADCLSLWRIFLIFSPKTLWRFTHHILLE